MKDFFKKIYWRAAVIASIVFLPSIAFCETPGSTGGTPGSTGSGLFKNPLKATDLSSLIENLAKYATQIGATIAVVMIIYSGYKFVSAQGEPKKIEEAKQTFYYTVIGTAILLGAWVIATAVKGLITGLQ